MVNAPSISKPEIALEVERSASGHFHLHVLRVIQRIVEHLYAAFSDESLERLLADYPFVEGYWRQLQSWDLDGGLAAFEADYEGHLPLRTLQRELGLSSAAVDVLLAAGLIEEDIQFGALFAALQHPVEKRHACLGILSWLLPSDDRDAHVVDTAELLADRGLVEFDKDGAGARLEWTLRAPLPIWDAVRGDRAPRMGKQVRFQPAGGFPLPDTLILPEALRCRVAQLPAMIAAGSVDTVVMRGMTGAGRRTTLGAIARALHRDLLLYDGGDKDERARQLLGPLATLTGALPVVRLDAGPGETIRLERLPGYNGVLGVTMGRTGGIEGSAMDNALTLYLPPPDYEQRARFWQASGLPLTSREAELVTERFLLTGGRIVRVAAAAHNAMRLEGRAEATADDVRVALRAANRQALETLATPLEAVPDWSYLVVPDRVASELAVLEARCRNRERLLDHVGPAFAHTLNRGVRVLFSGPSGTGKTLAARALAGALHMDVYRVDLASVVNKYIGETEKNLNRVFTYAEELDIVLLLDEGDSLMTQRTDVRGANDRYANLETNFLLQRLETYEGIILITTNAGQRIDDAFIRRLDVTVDFVMPDAEERRRLWELHLSPDHAIDPAFLERVVARCKLSGGQIRNSALHASLLALPHRRPVQASDLEAALQREYRKAAQPYPLSRSRQ